MCLSLSVLDTRCHVQVKSQGSCLWCLHHCLESQCYIGEKDNLETYFFFFFALFFDRVTGDSFIGFFGLQTDKGLGGREVKWQ